MKMAALPAAATSAAVIAPARQTMMSAQAKRSAMFDRKGATSARNSRGAYGIIVAFAGLVHNLQLILSRREKIHGIHKGPIDGQSALAASRNEQVKGFLGLAGRNREELRAHRAAGDDGLFSPPTGRNFIAGGNALRQP